MNSGAKAITSLIIGTLALVATVQAANKVQVCHIPPDNPSHYHTITISENALEAHLGHGDFPGSCYANAEALCDDGNPCTIDAMDPQTETCLTDHAPVNCDDSNPCTNDSCDPASGCQYAPVACNDHDACTVDACNSLTGECASVPIECGAQGYCVPETGLCDYPCEGITCDPIDQCHEAGQCVLPGECVDGAPVADGTPCDDGLSETYGDVCTNGVCSGVCNAPVITNYRVVTIATNDITVAWDTDVDATSQVVYRLAVSAVETTTPADGTRSTQHQVTVTGLTANTDYVLSGRSETDCGYSLSEGRTIRTRR